MTEEKPRRKRERTDSMRKKENEYKQRTLREFTFKLNREKDAELIEAYENIENKREFIREALRRYIAEQKDKTEDQ